MVGAVRVVLALEAECAAAGILDTLFAHKASVQEVSCIELYTGLIRKHFHYDT